MPVGQNRRDRHQKARNDDGCENNEKANAEAFYDGFRTGDQGVMTRTATFRSRGDSEIINRGGEKISPREVDEIIMGHPAVHQCVVRDPARHVGRRGRGGDRAATGHLSDRQELREYASARLAPYKVPKKFHSQIPVGATGSCSIGLHKNWDFA